MRVEYRESTQLKFSVIPVPEFSSPVHKHSSLYIHANIFFIIISKMFEVMFATSAALPTPADYMLTH